MTGLDWINCVSVVAGIQGLGQSKVQPPQPAKISVGAIIQHTQLALAMQRDPSSVVL